MNNYTVKEENLTNLHRYIKSDSTKGNLKNFVEIPCLGFQAPSKEKAEEKFEEKSEEKKRFIEKVVICLILLCHSPFRGIKEFLEIIFDYKISLGGISNIVARASELAKSFNESQDLRKIKEGALDEIFSNSIPALVGVDLKSSFIFLLEEGQGRSGDDWGLALLEKQENQGLALDFTVMDQATGLYKGVREIYPQASIGSDIFHTIREIFKVLHRLESKAYKSIKEVYKVEDEYLKALLKSQGQKYGRKYKSALKEMGEKIALYDDFCILIQWFYESIDIYSTSYEDRIWIYDYIVEEIEERSKNKEDIKSLVKHLKNNKEKLLCFARLLEKRLIKFKEETHYDLTMDDLKALYRQLTLDEQHCRYWVLEGTLLSKFGKDLKNIQAQIKEIINNTFRASSIVENVNSLIRPYFFLRKSIGRSNFLNLLQFYFNTKIIKRCDKFPGRIGKTRLELLTGRKHPNWLQLLGY